MKLWAHFLNRQWVWQKILGQVTKSCLLYVIFLWAISLKPYSILLYSGLSAIFVISLLWVILVPGPVHCQLFWRIIGSRAGRTGRWPVNTGAFSDIFWYWQQLGSSAAQLFSMKIRSEANQSVFKEPSRYNILHKPNINSSWIVIVKNSFY